MLQKSSHICRFAQPLAEQAAFLHFKRRHNAEKYPHFPLRQTVTPTPNVYSQLGTHGFSLIELMVALSIFMIVSLGALPLMISNVHLNQRNQVRNDSIAVASRWVDWLHTQSWRPTSTSALNVPDVAQAPDPIDSRFQYAIDCTQIVTIPANRRFDCDVTVDWTYRGQTRSYDARTIIIE